MINSVSSTLRLEGTELHRELPYRDHKWQFQEEDEAENVQKEG